MSESESEEEEKTSQHNDDQRARSPSPPVRHGEHRRLDKSNKGMMMLMKMGWTQGKGLGAQNDGKSIRRYYQECFSHSIGPIRTKT